MRDDETDNAAFRAALRELAMMLVYEATRGLPVRRAPVRTPGGEALGRAGPGGAPGGFRWGGCPPPSRGASRSVGTSFRAWATGATASSARSEPARGLSARSDGFVAGWVVGTTAPATNPAVTLRCQRCVGGPGRPRMVASSLRSCAHCSAPPTPAGATAPWAGPTTYTYLSR